MSLYSDSRARVLVAAEEVAPVSRGARGVVSARRTDGSVLLLSMRRLEDLVAYSMTYEFEDVIAETTGARRIDVSDELRLEFSRRSYKLLRYASGSQSLARALSPPPATVRLTRDYELFLPTFNHAYELYALATIPGWRKRCRLAACFIAEIWIKELPSYLLELLADFDHIFVGVQNPVADVARISGRPCTFLPMAADVLLFSPYPESPQRVIDACNIGRRSTITHQALLRLARERRFFYYYDTVAASGVGHKQRTFRVQNASEHRQLHAQLLQRSRYYFANRSRVNEPEFTMGIQEISGRYYEGAAAGTVMIGEPPDNAAFRSLFDWEDAVINVPFDAPDIASILQTLDAEPERLARVRRDNAYHAALRHDWLHRLRLIYETLGLPLTEGMREREAQLQSLAALARQT